MASKYKWDNSNLPKQDAQWESAHSLGQKIEIMFTRFIQRVFLWVIDFISDRLVDIFDNSMKIMRPGTARATDAIIKEVIANFDLPPYMKEAFQQALIEEGESSFIIKIAVFYSSVMQSMMGGLAPVRRLAEYNADKTARSFLPSVGEFAFMNRVGLVSDQKYQENMAKLGVAEPLIPVYTEIARNLPSLGELFNGLWREKYSLQEFTALLHRMGYAEKDIDVLTELSKNLPPLQDLIRMLVRDAFNDQASSTYGYDEDFPEEINQFFAKQGYDPDWAKRYWRAHWQLPSPQQAYEMLHRSLITVDDMETLLRISDYPKFWRDKLRDISFNVMTRVDVRRLLQAGIIDANKALDTYKKMGYTPEDAKLLTDFAVAGISNDEKDLTKTEILNLYEEGLLDRDAIHQNLVKMGYDNSEADDIIALADVNIAKAQRTDLINYVKEKFLARLIDEMQARTELSNIGLKQQSVDRYVMSWHRATEVENAIPSMADGKRWYLLNLITEERYAAILKQHKHTDENISLYILEANNTKANQNEQSA